jgi:hypothetical protein
MEKVKKLAGVERMKEVAVVERMNKGERWRG